MSTPPPHHEVKELALQLLLANHCISGTLEAGARAVERAKEAYALAQVYLSTLDDLEPRGQLGVRPPRPRPEPTSAPGGGVTRRGL